MGLGSFLKVLLKNFDVLTGPLISLVYPLYASIRAIETRSPTDDRQWLTYWVLYSMITLFELTFTKALEWVPVWPYAKFLMTCWLVVPYFKGATYVYEHLLRPLFLNPQSINIWYVPGKKDAFKKPDDILTAAEKYIDEHGTQEFESLVKKSDKAKWMGSSSSTVVYDEDYGHY
jgi:receptor expression-enhancing protein 5/6